MKIFFFGNADKLREVQEIASLFAAIEGVNIPLPEIASTDLHEVLEAKLRSAQGILNRQSLLVEHTTLSLEGLNDFPGALTGPTLKMMGLTMFTRMAMQSGSASATATTALGYCSAEGEIRCFEGTMEGRVRTPKGSRGFGWDSIFVPKGYQQTFAEMASDEKNAISMRRKALMELRGYLENERQNQDPQIRRIAFGGVVQGEDGNLKAQAVFLAIVCKEAQPYLNYPHIDDKQQVVPIVLFTHRSDGTFGFPGGKVDPGENLVEAIFREVREEIGLSDLQVRELVPVCSHDIIPGLVTHLYAVFVNYVRLKKIAQHAHTAVHFGSESNGVVQAKIHDFGEGCGLSEILKSSFVPSAREELVILLEDKRILPLEQLKKAVEGAGYSFDKLVS